MNKQVSRLAVVQDDIPVNQGAEAEPASPEEEPLQEYRPPRFGGNALWVLALNLILIVLFQYFSRNGAFLNIVNVTGILITYSQILLLVVAQTILLSAAQIDLSQGANVVLSSVASGLVLVGMSQAGDPGASATLPVLFTVAALTGATVGLLNGLLVGWLRINSLVATLGTLGIVLGTAQVITNGDNLYGVPPSIQTSFGMKEIFDIPLPTLTAFLIVALIWLQFSKTRFGLHNIAIGSSEKAAQRNGIAIARKLIMLYVVAGLLCGIAGAFDISRFTTTDIGGHSNDALASISGAVIGGTSLFGGPPNFLGSLLGALLALILQSGLVVLNFPPFYQTIAIGIVLVIAVAVDRLKVGREPR
jgi:ribose transport system permease protein